MKLFNVYRNELMPDYVYIQLNDDKYIYVGTWDPIPLPGVKGHVPFSPASEDHDSYKKIGLVDKSQGVFKKDKTIENQGFEVDIPHRYRRSIIKHTLGTK